MSSTIPEILEALESVYEVQGSFDAQKSRWNVMSFRVESLFQDAKVHLLPKEAADFLRAIRYTIPSPQSVRDFEPVFREFKAEWNKVKLHGAHTGRVSGKHLNYGNRPRSSDGTPAYVSPVLFDDTPVTHHTPSPSPSDSCASGSSSDGGGGGGCGD